MRLHTDACIGIAETRKYIGEGHTHASPLEKGSKGTLPVVGGGWWRVGGSRDQTNTAKYISLARDPGVPAEQAAGALIDIDNDESNQGPSGQQGGERSKHVKT